MAATSSDAVTVGGGLAGGAFAKAMAEGGAKVLVVERETRFKDRVRGEMLVPWGVAEARELGILPALKAACAHQVGLVEMGTGPRDLAATTEQRCPALTSSRLEPSRRTKGECDRLLS